jgi:phosphopantothenoylcysteine decarboxylase/phosphopantothenate--cysteine ligase
MQFIPLSLIEWRKWKWNNHVELGLWADIIIAPAAANTMSKMANGTCDNLLLTYLQSVLFILLRNGFRYVQASLYNSYFKALHEFGNTIILLKVVN